MAVARAFVGKISAITTNVKGPNDMPATLKWWDGDNAYAVDFTNPSARDWFKENLKNFQKVIHYFLFCFLGMVV